MRADRALCSRKVGKHFDTEIADEGFAYACDKARIAVEAALDGSYVVRASVPAEELSAERCGSLLRAAGPGGAGFPKLQER